MVKVLSVFLLCAIQLIYKNNAVYAEDDDLEDLRLRCPKLNPCYTILKYNVSYRCFVDEVCPEGYKCCRSDCYIHKVCVVPVDNNGEIIIPPPTTTVSTETTSEILTTITEEFSTGSSKTTRFEGSGEGSGDTEDGDDESDGSGDIKIETTRGLPTTTSERPFITTVQVEVTTFTSTSSPFPSTYSGSGDDDERDDDEKDDDFDGSGNNEQNNTSSISSSIVTKFTTHISSTDLTTQKPKITTPYEETYPPSTKTNEIGSGDDDEDDDDKVFDGRGDNKQIERPVTSSASTFSTSKINISDISTLALPTNVTPTEPRTSERTTTGLTTPLITRASEPLSRNNDSEDDGDTEDDIEFSGSGEEDKAEPPVTTSVVNITTAATSTTTTLTTLTTIKPEASTLLVVTFSKLTTKLKADETNRTDKPPSMLLTTGTVAANLTTYTASSLPTTQIFPEVITPLPTGPVETGSGDKEHVDDDDRETDDDDFEFDGSEIEDKSKTLTSLIANITKSSTSTTKILTTTKFGTSSLGEESVKSATVSSTETFSNEDFKDDEAEGSGSGDEDQSSTAKSTVSSTESPLGLNIVTILSSSLSPSSENTNKKVNNDDDKFKSTTYVDEIQLSVASNVTKFSIPTELTIKPESSTRPEKTYTPLELGSGYRNANEDDDEDEIEKSKTTVPSINTTLKVPSLSIKSTEPDIHDITDDDDFKVEGIVLTSRSTDKELSTAKPVEVKSELSKLTSTSINGASRSFATPPSVTSTEYSEDDEDYLERVEGSGENLTTIGVTPEVAVTNLLSSTTATVSLTNFATEEKQVGTREEMTTQVNQDKLRITTNKLTVSSENTTSSLSTLGLPESDKYSSDVIDIDYDPSKDQKQPTITTLTTKPTVGISEELDKLSTPGKGLIDSRTSVKFDDSADLGSGLTDTDAEEGEGGFNEVQTKESSITISRVASFSTTIKKMTTVGPITSKSKTTKIDTKIETTVASPFIDSSTGTSVKHESTATSTNKAEVPSSVKNPITPFNALVSSKQILDSLEEGSGNDYSNYDDDDFNHKA